MNWKKTAVRLARAIVRFQNDDFKHAHNDSTVVFALRVIRKAKRS